MIFKKNWPFTGLLNYHLLLMKEKGVIERLKNFHLKSKTKASCPDEHTIHQVLKKPRPVGIGQFVSLYLIMGIGLLGSMILLVMEYWYK